MNAPSVTLAPAPGLTANEVPLSAIARDDWDALLARTAAATPFSRWSFHRAWWDAYGDNAHEQYLAVTGGAGEAGAAGELRAIVPLMHRHEVEPYDVPTHTTLRPHSPMCQPVPGEARAVMFGASYHADYATILAAPEHLPDVSRAVVAALAAGQDEAAGHEPWDVIDLRRLRAVDPALDSLEGALRTLAGDRGWRVTREVEDVCPVVTVRGHTWDEYLATLDKKDRHEVRRKMRRAAAIGELSVEIVPPTPDAIDDFVRLHNLRFGERGLFPDNEGGERSRHFVNRLAELEIQEPGGGQLHVARVYCGARLIFIALAFDDGHTCFLYNAGMDPGASTASPGVTGAALYFKDRIEAGRRRFDYLRGDEKYKYEWGAVDEPIYRLLLERQPS